jgi:diphosphomevalonate decarboxylase
MTGSARAVAHTNIALAKYWGKLAAEGNLPAVPSLSMTLDAMSTTTSVGFGHGLESDRVALNGRPATEAEASRVVQMLDRVREMAGIRTRAWVETANDFPTASGLASSASGFAALALAATCAAGLDFEPARWSDLARRSSASAARSIFGGFVALAAGTDNTSFLAAEPIVGATDWDVALCVAVTTTAQKPVGSTAGMRLTASTSAYYGQWLSLAPALYAQAKQAVLCRDLEALGDAAEKSSFAMHACAMASVPAIIYWNPTTVAVIEQVRALRASGTLAFATIDAGPHVKVLSAAADAPRITEAISQVPGVTSTLVARPGPAASVQLLRRGP